MFSLSNVLAAGNRPLSIANATSAAVIFRIRMMERRRLSSAETGWLLAGTSISRRSAAGSAKAKAVETSGAFPGCVAFAGAFTAVADRPAASATGPAAAVPSDGTVSVLGFTDAGAGTNASSSGSTGLGLAKYFGVLPPHPMRLMAPRKNTVHRSVGRKRDNPIERLNGFLRFIMDCKAVNEETPCGRT